MFEWVLNTPLELLIIFANSLTLDVWLGSRYWVTGFYASDMFKEIQNKCKIPVTESFLEMLQVKAKKWFLRNFWETLQRNDFLHSYFRQGLQEIPEQLCSTRAFLCLLKWNVSPSRISWQHTHSKLVGIFSQFLQLQHSSELNLSCWVSLHLGRFHHSNLGEFV